MFGRHIAPHLLAALADTPVVFVNGPRQCGKSTLVKQIAKRSHPAHYFTLDDPTVLAAAQQDPAGFIQAASSAIVIDEVQRAPELFLAIKAAVDHDRRPGRFLLTGSVNVMLLPKLSEALVGRMEILTLWPFSQDELSGRRNGFLDSAFYRDFTPQEFAGPDHHSSWDCILAGGFPEAVARKDGLRRQAWFESYLATMLTRDVRDIASVEGLAAFPRLVRLLAARTGGLLNFADISRSAGIPQSTLKRYMALLEGTFLLRLLPAWSANLGKRLVKSPKVFFSDAGIAAFLQGLTLNRLVADRTLAGPLLENFILMELSKQATWSLTRPTLHHFRTQTGKEVDLLLESAAGDLVGIEVKAAATVTADDFRGLKALASDVPGRLLRGFVLYTGTEVVPFGKNLYALPVTALF